MRGWMRRGVVRIGGVLGDSSFTVDLFGGRANERISVDENRVVEERDEIWM